MNPARALTAGATIARSEYGNDLPTLLLTFAKGTEFRMLRAAALRAAADVEEALLEMLAGHAGYCSETKIECDHGGTARITVQLAEGADASAVVAALARAGHIAAGRKAWAHTVHGERVLVSVTR